MRILVYGATGRIGSRFVAEAAQRGHHVTAHTRGDKNVPAATEVVPGDALDARSIAELAAGHDVIVSAISSGVVNDQPRFGIYLEVARALTSAIRSIRGAAPRIVIAGGAGSLEVSPGVRMLDTPDFPEAVKPEALAHARALEYWRSIDDVDWTYISPAGTLEPGERTGHYRRGTDQMLFDEDGRSYISMEDYATAITDELEKPSAHRRRITFAY